jgi:16S rRNA (guanine966-N2)-methyltransferase
VERLRLSDLTIIGGEFRNRKLKTPKGDVTRPTSAVLRKSVFDICMSHITDAHFLDLFAGSGAMGLEALSRGAAHATFVERDKNALRSIQENIALLKVESQCSVLATDILTALKRLQKQGDTFDLIYIDPPYDNVEITPLILNFIDQHALLKPDGILFVEEGIPSHLTPETRPYPHLLHQKSRRFSQSLLHQFTLA